MSTSLLLPKDGRACVALPPRMPPPRLPAHRLDGGSWATAVLPLRSMMDPQFLRRGDPARRVMTDFARHEAFTVAEDRLIEDALDDMFRFGVHTLLTARDGKVTGLVTSSDIQGERPRQLLRGRPELHREEIRVGDIRTPWSELPAVGWETVQQSHVSDLLEIFDEAGCSHLAVLERAADGSVLVRGLICHAWLQRQLERLI